MNSFSFKYFSFYPMVNLIFGLSIFISAQAVNGQSAKAGKVKPGKGSAAPKFDTHYLWKYPGTSGLTVGYFSGTYEDTEYNPNTNDSGKLTGVKLSGFRLYFDSYPTSWLEFNLDLRSMTVKNDFWKSGAGGSMTLGYILPWFKMVSLAVGGHFETHKVEVTKRNSPVVSKTGVKAMVLGIHAKRQVFEFDKELGFAVNFKFHLLNLPSNPSHGSETEFGPGICFLSGGIKAEFVAGLLKQSYLADEPIESGLKSVQVDGKTTLFFIRAGFWY